jgi:glycosyltransferase involved in cell wall biosynthesis
MTPEKLVIVMATYNGAPYLEEQLESIRVQTLTDWSLIIRDDGSSDETLAILRRYEKTDPRISVVVDSQGNLGASRSFGSLLKHALDSGADYVACSDQDDIWLPEKLARTYEYMRVLEEDNPPGTPVLMHTDLEVVNDTLERLNSSYMAYESVGQPVSPPLEKLLIQNHVVGCTMLANRALLKIALPVPADARMHDWWLALCARSTGVLGFLPERTIKYRQHGSNTLGSGGIALAKRVFARAWWKKLRKWSTVRIRVEKQANALRSWLNSIISTSHVNPEGTHVVASISCFDKNRLQGLYCAWRAGFRGQNWLATCLFYLFFMRSR